MSDLIRKSEPDRSRINMDDDAEVKSWTKLLGVSREELSRAVETVGNSAGCCREGTRQIGLVFRHKHVNPKLLRV